MIRISSSTVAIGLGASALLLITLLVTFTRVAPDTGEWDSTARLLLERDFEGPLEGPVPPTANSRLSAVYAGILIAGLLSFLYAYRRRRYISEWVGAWLLVSFGAHVISRSYASVEEATLAIGILEMGKVGTALLLLRSAHSLRRTVPWIKYDWLLLPVLAGWLALGGGRLGVSLVLAPAYVVAGLIYARAASLFALAARDRRMLGALLLAASVLVIGLTNVGFGVFFESVMTSGQLVGQFLAVNSLSFLAAAFGMHLLVFEEMAHELKATNRELRGAQEQLEKLATIDALTGCNNRHFLEQNVHRELERHRRYGTPMSLVFVDVDDFKRINDAYGHDVGDRVLEHVGRFLGESVREADYVVRWGGDEFLILMTCTAAEARAKAASLEEAFREIVDSSVLPPRLSLSIGYAEVPPDATEIESTLRLADRNMYLNKAGNRG